MQLDKETVIKHHFWFLLGGAVLFWLVAAIMLKFTAPDEIKKVEDAYTKAESGLKSAPAVNTATFNPPWEKYGSVFDGHKQVIWKDAWGLQIGMYDWPFGPNKDMSSPQTPLSQDERDLFKRELYPGEVKYLKAVIEGDPKNGQPGMLAPVELAGGFDNIFKPQEWQLTPTREECWLAQEDYWVKRELLYVVAGAIARRAWMERDDKFKDDKLPEGYLTSFRFHNENWEVTLRIKPSKSNKGEYVIAGDSTIKNIQSSHLPQSLTSAKGGGMAFNVYQGNTNVQFEVKGEPVPWDHEQSFGKDQERALAGIDWTRAKSQPNEYAVNMSQAFDWYTCPIRRVEAIALGQQSCRTYTTGLKANSTLAKLDPLPKEEADASQQQGSGGGAGGAGGASGGPGGGMLKGGGSSQMGGGMMMGGPMGAQGAKQATNVTPNNGIDRDRYLQEPKKEGETTEKPSRHIPMALQLIVDQAHIHDVLAAVANSRLRIQITQVEFHHARGIKPENEPGKDGEVQRTAPIVMAGGMGGGARPPMVGSSMMGGGKTPPGMVGGGMPPGMIGSAGMGPGMKGGSRPLGGAGGAGGAGGKMPPMGPMGGMMMPGKFGGVGGAGGSSLVRPTGATGGSGTADKKTAPKPDDDNLVELTIYGIATLYRLPSSLEKPAESGVTAAGAPAGK